MDAPAGVLKFSCHYRKREWTMLKVKQHNCFLFSVRRVHGGAGGGGGSMDKIKIFLCFRKTVCSSTPAWDGNFWI